MDKRLEEERHRIYLQEFIEELSACGYDGPMTEFIVKQLNILANEGKSPIQSAQTIYILLNTKK